LPNIQAADEQPKFKSVSDVSFQFLLDSPSSVLIIVQGFLETRLAFALLGV
jgi:hypothetical protein